MIRKQVALMLALGTSLAALSASAAAAQEEVFHKGDSVLITPYGGAWAECTLTSDRLGYTRNYSYMAVCAPMSAASTPDNRPHLYSAERVKSVNDPAAQAGLAQMRAQFPPSPGTPPAPPAAQQAQRPQANPPPVQTAERAVSAKNDQQAAQASGPGGTFKGPGQCATGTRVTDKQGKSGTVVGIDRYMSLCQVRLDDGSQNYYLFWMLHSAGTSAETNDKLVPGTYKCYASGNYAFMDVSVTGPGSYSSAGSSGRFRVMPSRDIVFDSGPLTKYRAHLLDGPSIGLNSNGDSFYGTTCDLQK